MVSAGGEHKDGVAIDEGLHGDFLAGELLLDHDAGAGVAEGPLVHDAMDGGDGLFDRFRHDDAFSAREACGP